MQKLLCFVALLTAFQASAQLPFELPGLQLWVRGDSAMELNGGRIITWFDLSQNENDLFQTVNNWRPAVVYDELNGHTVVNFNGVNRRFLFNEVNTIRTVVWVARQPEDLSSVRRPILGHSNTFHFFRGPEQFLWDFQSSPNVLNGVTRMGFDEIDGEVTPIPPDQWQIINVVTAGDVEANQLGQDRNTNNFWQGDFAEMLIFSEALTPEQIIDLENYLADYYTDPLDLGDDLVIEYGVCQTQLEIGPGFTEILWSTGETTPQIEVDQSGTYWVQARDVFGRIVTDTLSITYPGNALLPESLTVCTGETAVVDLELDDEDYAVEWSDDQTGSIASFSAQGAYTATIADTTGCSVIREFFINIDDFSNEASLGADRELCAGNSIEIENAGELESIVWMDEFEFSYLQIIETGSYFVEAVNVNGCLLQDTVEITIVGQAPQLTLNQPELICEGQLAEFSADVVADSPIDSWVWTFPDGSTSVDEFAEWQPLDWGGGNIQLIVTSEAGCESALTETINSFPSPTATITSSQACTGNQFIVNTQPQVENGTVETIQWDFQGQSFTSTPISIFPTEAGFHPITLTLTADNGCVTTIEQLINVIQSPEIEISAPFTCLGALTPFTADVIVQGSGTITSYQWFFGDNTTSTQTQPQHLYASAGTYNPQLQVVSSTGCFGVAGTQVQVVPPPVADFTVSNACVGTPEPFVDESNSDDAISSWLWTFNGLEQEEGEMVTFTFNEVGFNAVNLFIETENGCTAQITRQVPVFEVPEVDFAMNPPIGLPPLSVNFQNLSSGAVSYFWTTETTNSDEANFNHTFTDEGSIPVTLVATNTYGCSAEQTRFVNVTEPLLDLVVESFSLTENNQGITATMSFYNAGNFTVDEVACRLTPGNGNAITEYLLESIAPGQAKVFTWTSIVEPLALSYPFFCGAAYGVTPFAEEQTPLNNVRCSERDDAFALIPLFPNPVRAGEVIYQRVILPEADKATMTIYNALGQMVFETEPHQLREGFNEILLDVSALSAGSYTLVYRDQRRTESQQLQVLR